MEYWATSKVTTEPSIEPVTVNECKEQLRIVDFTDHDSMITGYIIAAREAVEGAVGRQLITATRTVSLESFPCAGEPLFLSYSPVQSITSITYTDLNGDSQTWDSSKYDVDTASVVPRIYPAYDETWPDTACVLNAVTVTYSCGYGETAADVPRALRQLIISVVCSLYEHPESEVEIKLEENKAWRLLMTRYQIRGVE